jgi:hypothetical protein
MENTQSFVSLQNIEFIEIFIYFYGIVDSFLQMRLAKVDPFVSEFCLRLQQWIKTLAETGLTTGGLGADDLIQIDALDPQRKPDGRF